MVAHGGRVIGNDLSPHVNKIMNEIIYRLINKETGQPVNCVTYGASPDWHTTFNSKKQAEFFLAGMHENVAIEKLVIKEKSICKK